MGVFLDQLFADAVLVKKSEPRVWLAGSAIVFLFTNENSPFFLLRPSSCGPLTFTVQQVTLLCDEFWVDVFPLRFLR